MSEGDRAALDRAIGRGRQLTADEINERGRGSRTRRFSSLRHEDVVDYLARRHARGERIWLEQVEVGRGPPFHSDEDAGDEVIGANIGVGRRAPDLARLGLDCDKGYAGVRAGQPVESVF